MNSTVRSSRNSVNLRQSANQANSNPKLSLLERGNAYFIKQLQPISPSEEGQNTPFWKGSGGCSWFSETLRRGSLSQPSSQVRLDRPLLLRTLRRSISSKSFKARMDILSLLLIEIGYK